MAAAPYIKVYDAQGKYQASVKEYEAAACLMGFYGEGATVRLGHTTRGIIWTEGVDGFAGESYDEATEKMLERAKDL